MSISQKLLDFIKYTKLSVFTFKAR